MLEHRKKPLLPRRKFLSRLFRYVLFSASIIFLSLILGVVGYHYIAHFSWVDSVLNASMILGGMGEVNELTGNRAKLFASFYALASGIVIISSTAILLVPVVHRMLHKFHLE